MRAHEFIKRPVNEVDGSKSAIPGITVQRPPSTLERKKRKIQRIATELKK